LKNQKLTKKSEFDSLYATGSKRTVGPLLIHKNKNNLEYSRLGLSIPKRVGNAVIRNRIKRLCREAFMQSKDDLPNSLDVLITIRPHTALKLSQYKELILKGIGHE
jgi:ribonuclease P protein component